MVIEQSPYIYQIGKSRCLCLGSSNNDDLCIRVVIQILHISNHKIIPVFIPLQKIVGFKVDGYHMKFDYLKIPPS